MRRAAALLLILAAGGGAAGQSPPRYEVPPPLRDAPCSRPEVYAALAAEAAHGDFVRGREAALSLASFGREAVPAMVRALDGAGWFGRATLVAAIAEADCPEAEPVLLEAARDDSFAVREAAAAGLARGRTEAAARCLLALAGDASWRVRETAAWSLRRLATLRRADRGTVVRALLALAADRDRDVRLSALRALGLLRAPEARPLFVAGSAGEDEDLRDACYDSLLHLPAPADVLLPDLEVLLRDADDEVFRRAAVRAAEIAGPRLLAEHGDRLRRLMREDFLAAAKIFEKMGREAAPFLLRELRDAYARPDRQPLPEDLSRAVLDLVARLLGPEMPPVLAEILTDWDEALPARRYAAILGARHHAAALLPVFRAVYEREGFADLRATLLAGIAAANPPDLPELLQKALAPGNLPLQTTAAKVLMRRPDIPCGDAVRAALRDPRCEAMLAGRFFTLLSVRGDAGLLDAAREYLAHPDPKLRRVGAEWIGAAADKAAALAALTEAWRREDGLDHGRPPDPDVPPEALRADRSGVILSILQGARLWLPEAALPLFLEVAGDRDPFTRAVAYEELGGHPSPEARARLLEALDRETDPDAFAKGLVAAARRVDAGLLTRLEAWIGGADEDRRCRALRALKSASGEVVPAALLDGLGSGAFSATARREAAEVLGRFAVDGRVALLGRLATEDPDHEVRVVAVQSLGRTGDTAAVPALLELLPVGEEEPTAEAAELAAEAIEALGLLRAEAALPALLRLLAREWPLALADPSPDHSHHEACRLLLTAVGRVGTPASLDPLLGLLVSPELVRGWSRLDEGPPRERGSLLGTLVAALVRHPDDRLCERWQALIAPRWESGVAGRLDENYLTWLAALVGDPRRPEVGRAQPRRRFAEALLSLVLRLAPRDTAADLSALSVLAEAAAERGDFAAAAAHRAEHLALLALRDPWAHEEREIALRAGVEVLGGVSLARAGDEAAGLAACRAARDRAPDDPEVLNTFAWYLASAGLAPEEALAAATEAAARAPSDAGVLDTLGFVLLRAGRAEEAVAALDDAVSRDRKETEDAAPEEERRAEPAYSYRLAAALSRAGDPAAAGAMLERAVAMDDTLADAARGSPDFSALREAGVLEAHLAAALSRLPP